MLETNWDGFSAFGGTLNREILRSNADVLVDVAKVSSTSVKTLFAYTTRWCISFGMELFTEGRYLLVATRPPHRSIFQQSLHIFGHMGYHNFSS
jgi:hypothetical protein